LKLSAEAIQKTPAPVPLITGMDFGDKEYLRLSTGGKLMFTGDSSENLKIPFAQNTVRIRVGHSGMPFPQDKIEYAWQLSPLENTWKRASESGEAEYPRLDAGEYTFRFRVREAGMEWSPSKEISFTISPPWWETWWFRLLEAGGGIFLIYGFVLFRTRSLKKEKDKLELTVKERTAEVVEQKEVIEHKNRNILQSMEYASRIQRNILPPISELKSMVPESFILYQPKDIVSGDFYWFHSIPEDSHNQPDAFGESVLIAACDCTGHGIPGAMVSVVCRGALQKAVRELKLKKPAEILAEASKVVALELGKITNTDADIPDGMDVSMCRLDLKNKQLQWAGAHNPLWILRKGEILETKGDNVSIGSRNESIHLTGHQISLESGDFLFMFSDGFADQFGGPKEKKLTKQGFKNMLISLENEPAGSFREKLLAAHLEWKGTCSQVDDICVVGIKI
jgi:serine phosphatase RsbU (regulator of sigma subunit)